MQQEEALREDRKQREALQKEEREVELEKGKLKQKIEVGNYPMFILPPYFPLCCPLYCPLYCRRRRKRRGRLSRNRENWRNTCN